MYCSWNTDKQYSPSCDAAAKRGESGHTQLIMDETIRQK